MLGTQNLFLAIPLSYHWCLTANLMIGIYNGEMVFNRLLGNVWSDLDDFFGRPTWNFNSDEMAKKLAIWHATQLLHYDFGQFWTKCDSFFGGALFFIWGHQLATFGDQSAMLGEHLSQKVPLAPPYNPKIWPKTCRRGVQKWVKILS